MDKGKKIRFNALINREGCYFFHNCKFEEVHVESMGGIFFKRKERASKPQSFSPHPLNYEWVFLEFDLMVFLGINVE